MIFAGIMVMFVKDVDETSKSPKEEL